MRTGDLRRTFEFLTTLACQRCEVQNIGGFDLIPVGDNEEVSDITRYRFVVAPVNRIVEDRTLKGNQVVRERGTHMVRVEVPSGGTGGVSGPQARDIAYNDGEQVVRLFEHGQYFRVPGWSDTVSTAFLEAGNYAALPIPDYFSPSELNPPEDDSKRIPWAEHARKVMELTRPMFGGYQAVTDPVNFNQDDWNWDDYRPVAIAPNEDADARTAREAADAANIAALQAILGQTGDILVIDPPQILEGYDDRDERKDSESTYYVPVMINYIATSYPKPNGDVRG